MKRVVGIVAVVLALSFTGLSSAADSIYRSGAWEPGMLPAVFVDPVGCGAFVPGPARGVHAIRVSWSGWYTRIDDFTEDVDLQASIEGTIDDASGATWAVHGAFAQRGPLATGTDLLFDGTGTLDLVGTPGLVETAASLRIVSAPNEIQLRYTLVVSCEAVPGPTLAEPAVVYEATGPQGALLTPAPRFDGAVGAPECPTQWYPLGVTTVECTARDAAGVVGRGLLSVEVVDTTPPAFAPGSGRVSVPATSGDGAVVTVAPPTADAVDGAGLARCTPAAPSVFPIGSSTVTCAAVDAAGNTSSLDVEVVVLPVGRADAFVVRAGKATAIPAAGVLANDLAGGGVAVLASAPAHGTVSLLPSGGFTYVPAAGCAGSDSFTYVVRHDGAESAPVLVTLTVAAPVEPAEPPRHGRADRARGRSHDDDHAHGRGRPRH